MTQINRAGLTDALITQAAGASDLNQSLKTLFDVLDPDNKYDLGGLAGLWFSVEMEYQAPADNGFTIDKSEIAWPYLSETARREHLERFLNFERRVRVDDI